MTSYELVYYTGSSILGFVHAKLSLDPTTGNILVDTTHTGVYSVYLQVKTVSGVISTNNWRLDVEVCGQEVVSMDQSATNITVAYEKTGDVQTIDAWNYK